MNYRFPVTVLLANGVNMQVYWTDLGVGQHLLRAGMHEQEAFSVLRRLVKTGMTVLDVGAQVGQYTVETSALVGPHGAVHAFEPEPANFRLLVANIATNRLMNVDASQMALSDCKEARSLYLAVSRNAGAHSFARGAVASGQTIRVACTTLDMYCAERGLVPDLIKIDVEGFELAVLTGGRNILERARPLLIVEFNDYNQSLFGRSCLQLSAFLREQCGYTLLRIDTPAPMTPSAHGIATYFNALAVPNERAEVIACVCGDTPATVDDEYAAWGVFCSPRAITNLD